MTPACDTCQLDFRPGEEADMETWEREGVARCHACAREFAALRRLVDGVLDICGAWFGQFTAPPGWGSGDFAAGGIVSSSAPCQPFASSERFVPVATAPLLPLPASTTFRVEPGERYIITLGPRSRANG